MSSSPQQQQDHSAEIYAMKILIVDDEPFNVALLERILHRASYTQVISTTDSRQAVGLCHEQHPDIVLLDLRMPYMDGFDVMRSMNESQDLRNLPVIVLTAENNAENRMHALSEGAKDFISKPFDRNETLRRIHNTLESRLLHKQLMEQNRDLDKIVQERTTELRLEQQRLRELNDNLENLVAERTADLQYANEELERANNTMSELVSIVSHELRTPLTSIKSFAEILRDEADNLDREEQGNFLTIIDKESDRLTRLISDLLDLQKMHAGKMAWKSEMLDIVKIAQETAEFFTPAFGNKNLELNFSCSLGSAKTLCDSDKLIQVLSNLLSNALKFTEQGGVEITISRNSSWASALLISNDQSTVKVLTTIFNDMQMELIHLESVDEAITRLNSDGGYINVAIVDLATPDADVANHLEIIRKRYPSLPLATIINSGSENTFQSLSWVGTLKKPITLDKSYDHIESLITNLLGMTPMTTMIDIGIIDSGIGIPADELNKVFMQFHQVDSSQTRERQGTGLGLTISKEIIEHYGGRIWVESRMGQGSTFHVLLPEFKEDKKKLGEILIEKGIVTEEQLSEALQHQ